MCRVLLFFVKNKCTVPGKSEIADSTPAGFQMSGKIFPAAFADFLHDPFHGISSAEVKNALSDFPGTDMAAFPVKGTARTFGEKIIGLADPCQFVQVFVHFISVLSRKRFAEKPHTSSKSDIRNQKSEIRNTGNNSYQ